MALETTLDQSDEGSVSPESASLMPPMQPVFNEPTPEQVAALSVQPIRFQTHCIASWAGVMRKCVFTVPFELFATLFQPDSLVQRFDFDLANESSFHGQRDKSESHIAQMLEDFKRTARPFLGTITLAINANEVQLDEKFQEHEYVHWAVLTIPAMASNPLIEDGQHRIEMARRLRAYAYVRDAEPDSKEYELRELLERTSVDVTLLLEGNPDVLSSIFVRMGRTKPISADLMVVMDQDSKSNRLAKYVIRYSTMLNGRVSWLATQAMKRQAKDKGQKFEPLYGAAAIRGAVCSIAGVGVRDRNSGDRERFISELIEERARSENITADQALEAIGKEIVGLIDYAYGVLPGWREVQANRLSVARFRQQYVHGSTAGLYVISNIIAAARLSGVSPHAAIDAATSIEWNRNDLRSAMDQDGKPIQVHTMFEHTLVSTRYDSSKSEWVASSISTRSGYETAISKVLRRLSKVEGLEPLASRSTFLALGVERVKRGPGRPPKLKQS